MWSAGFQAGVFPNGSGFSIWHPCDVRGIHGTTARGNMKIIQALKIRKISEHIRALCCGALTLLVITSAHAQGSSRKVTVVMPASAETYMIPFFVSEDAGFYRDAGITVDIKTLSGNQNALRAIITGA